LAGDDHTLSVEVLSPEGEVYKGDVAQLSTRTAVGEIGVLARHAPLLARLRPCELRLHVSEGETLRWAQAHGWLQVFANEALVLVEEAIPPEQLDPGQCREQISEAEQRLGESEEGTAAHERAQRDMERAEAFLAVAEGDGP
jgi:F-type H+-transporting ATPase subunit epsilon